MFNLKIYAIFAVIIAVMGGGFYFYYKTTEAEKALLIAQKAQLEMAVKTQEETITALKEMSTRLAKSNVELVSDLANAEAVKAKQIEEIEKDDDLHLTIQEIEKKINEDFRNSNRLLGDPS